MNESESTSANYQVRHKRTIILRRDDHVGDPIGLAFMDTPETGGDRIVARVRAYLGKKVKILKAEIWRDRLEIEVETLGFRAEAERLAAAARDLSLKGASRNAESMLREALAIDPLSAPAMAAYGLTIAAQGRYSEALASLKRAREFGANSVELLLAMARCAAALDRKTASIGYLEEVIEIEPKNFIARRALRGFGREPRPTPSSAVPIQNRRK